MYTTKDFKTKKELKLAVATWNDYVCNGVTAPGSIPTSPRPVELYAPGLGSPVVNGRDTVEGPHYPKPHRWWASVIVEDGYVIAVK